MPTTLAPVVTQTPFVDARGYVTRAALGWLQQSYLRQGGESAATNTELQTGIGINTGSINQIEMDLEDTTTTVEDLTQELAALQTAVLQLASDVEALTGRVTTLEGQVTTLETTVAEQGTRLAALEAWRTAVVAGLPAVVSVAALPTLTDAPASADALRDNLTSAWEGVLDTNDSALGATVNAVRNALAA
jgi:septal ring factor EnvC (AmiA/AmiB activator)